MAITFVNVGTFASVATGSTCTPGTPASIANNDILILLAYSPAGATITVDNSFTEKIAGGDTTNGTMKVFWKRTTGTEGTTTVTRSGGNGVGCQMAAYRGCVTSGDPFDVAGTVQLNTSTQPISTTSVTTATNNAMALHAVGNTNDAVFDSWTGTPTTERIDSGTASTTPDLEIGMAEGVKTTAGSIGAGGVTQASPTAAGVSVQFALKVAAQDLVVAGTGSTTFTLAGSPSRQQNLVLSGAPQTLFTLLGNPQRQQNKEITGNISTTFGLAGNPSIQHNFEITGVPLTQFILAGNPAREGASQNFELSGNALTAFILAGSPEKQANLSLSGLTGLIFGLSGNPEREDLQPPAIIKKYPFRAPRW